METILRWDLNYATNATLERNYSIAGIDDYNLKNNYVVGLD